MKNQKFLKWKTVAALFVLLLLALPLKALALSAPTNLSARVTSVTPHTEIKLTWTDNSADEAGFKIWCWLEDSPLKPTVGPNIGTYTFLDLPSSGTYRFRVDTFNAQGNVVTGSEIGPIRFEKPAAPSGLSAKAISSTQINLSWTDNSNNETGFKILRKTGVGGTYLWIATAVANVISYYDYGVSPNTTYYYKISATNAVGDSDYSFEAVATTPQSPPAAPSGLSATTKSSTQINLSWTDNSTNETGFRIERKTGADGTYGEIGILSANITSLLNTDLTPGTTYYYQIRATNTAGDSAYSNEANATTFYTLTINAANGSVVKSADKASYPSGERVTLTATPNSGYQFSLWSGDLTGSTNPATITMDANKTITANFSAITYTLTINAEHGSVTRSLDKPSYSYGESVTLTAVPAVGYEFSSWEGDLGGSNNPETITMNSNKNITAVMEESMPAFPFYVEAKALGTFISLSIKYPKEWHDASFEVRRTEDGGGFSNIVVEAPMTGKFGEYSFLYFKDYKGLVPGHTYTYEITPKGSDILEKVTVNYSRGSAKDFVPKTGGTTAGEPVDLANGNFISEAVDLFIPGRGIDLEIKRRYENQMFYSGPLGINWDFNYNLRLFEEADKVYLYRYAKKEIYTKSTVISGATYYLSPAGNFDRLVKNADGTFTDTEKDGLKYEFDAEGKLIRIQDRLGNRLAFSYAPGSIIITDTLGRSTTISLTDGKIAKITDFSGRQVEYAYEGDYLVSVSYPENTGLRYTYYNSEVDPTLNNNLRSIIDANQDEFVVNTYGTDPADPLTYDRVIQQVWRGGTVYFDYAVENSQPVTVYADREGNKTRYTFDDSGYLLREEKGFGSPAVFVTQHEYNANKLRTKTIHPDGLTVRWEYDDKGNMTKETRVAADSPVQVIKAYTYEPRFSQLKTFTDAMRKTTTHIFDYEEAALGDQNGDGITDRALGLVVKTVYPDLDLNLDGRYDPVAEKIEEKFVYNDNGQLIRKFDALNYAVSYSYNNGYLYQITVDPGDSTHLNLTTTYGVDVLGNITGITDPNGNVSTIRYDTLSRPIQKTDALGVNTLLKYDQTGNLLEQRVETGDSANPYWTTQYVYENGNLISKLEEVKPVADDNLNSYPDNVAITRYEYNREEKLSGLTSPEGRRVQVTYEQRHLPKEIIADPQGLSAKITRDYDAAGKLAKETDAAGNQATNIYDGLGRISRVTDPEGNYKYTIYDLNNNALIVRFHDKNGSLLSVSRYLRNSAGDVSFKQESILFPGQTTSQLIVTKYIFNQNRKLVKKIVSPQVSGQQGNVTTYSYDAAGRLKEVTDAFGNITTYVYDKNSNLIEERIREKMVVPTTGQALYASDFVTRYIYDKADRLIQVDHYGRRSSVPTQVPVDIFSEKFSYDTRGNLIEKVDGAGNISRYVFDGLNRKVREEVAHQPGAFLITEFAYDKDGSLLSFKDPNNNTTTYQYDNLNNLLNVVYPDAKQITHSYESGNPFVPAATILSDETKIRYSYDRNSRLLRKDIAYPSSQTNAVTYEEFTYDSFGRVASAKNDFSEARFNYDSRNRRIKESLSIDGGGFKDILAAYDNMNNLSSLAYPDGFKLNYAYDVSARITAITDSSQNKYASYNPMFKGGILRVDQKTYGSGALLTNYYDNIDRPLWMLNLFSRVSNKTNMFSYVCDKANNIVSETETIMPLSNKQSISFNYDKARRLISAGKESFKLDPAGNRIGLNVIGAGEPVSYDFGSPNELNQYTRVTLPSNEARDLTYDSAGNLTKDAELRTYAYDYANRLVNAKDKNGNTLAEFTYDALGRLIKKKTSRGSTLYYNFADNNIYREESGANIGYVFGQRPDEIICMIKGGQNFYYHPKALGTITALTDNAGWVKEQYSYSVFGMLTVKDVAGVVVSPDSAINLITFTGREYIPEIAKYYYRARFYDPFLGRFMQRDPVGYLAGANLYTYCENNPTTYIDPSGLCPTGSPGRVEKPKKTEELPPFIKDSAEGLRVHSVAGIIEKAEELEKIEEMDPNYKKEEPGKERGPLANFIERIRRLLSRTRPKVEASEPNKPVELRNEKR